MCLPLSAPLRGKNLSILIPLIAFSALALTCQEINSQERQALLSPLERLSSDELVHEYERRGLALAGTYDAPIDSDDCDFPATGQLLSFTVEPEIIRRGKVIVPALIGFLEREVPTSRPNLCFGFTKDILQMLQKIGDPRPVPAILRIPTGWEGKATLGKRRAALAALASLTHVHFIKNDGQIPSDNCQWESVEHPKAVSGKRITEAQIPQHLDLLAKLHREWLIGEGKDPDTWLTLAKQRARLMLTSDNTDSAYCAREFLERGAGAEKSK
jgi:hypothetical protein